MGLPSYSSQRLSLALVNHGLWLLWLLPLATCGQEADQTLPVVIEQTLFKMAKVTGSGGFRGIENYQTGCCISENGDILTAWSSVLDSDTLSVTLADGRKFPAQLIGYDPQAEIAILKIDGDTTAYFDVAATQTTPPAVTPGTTILAFSNLFGVAFGSEPMSVQRGIVAATTRLAKPLSNRGFVYPDEVYLLDAVTNNPGTSGGAITDRQGNLIAMIGKEYRNSETGTWMNYAIPIEQLIDSIDSIRAGQQVASTTDEDELNPAEPLTAALLGLVMVPDVVDRTPPYVDRVVAGSIADRAGLLADDLIIAVEDQLVPSILHWNSRLRQIDRNTGITITIRRDQAFQSFTLRLSPASLSK